MQIVIGPNEAGQRLDKFLRKYLKEVPLSRIFKGIRKGDIKVNSKKQKEKYSLELGDIVEIKYMDIDNTAKKEKKINKVDTGSLKIIYEDDNLLLLEKWPGVLVHSDKKNGEATLTDYALSHLFTKGDYDPSQEITFTPASCNRLDRNTSGMVIFGKNFESLKCLNEMIRDRKIEKYYTALVKGKLADGEYTAYISKDQDNNLSSVFAEEKKGTAKIMMKVKTMQTNGAYSLLELELITGKSHQLRAHLAFLGNPIIGDPKYGDKKLNSFFDNKYGLNYQYLYAYKLIFRDTPSKLRYLEDKTIAQSLPPIFRRIKKDVFKVVI